MTKKYSGIIFDLDGTLVDTEPLFVDAFVDAAALYGFEHDREDAHKRFTGTVVTGLGEGTEAIVGHSIPEGFEADFNRLYEIALQGEVKALDGVKETLQTLKSREMKTSIASNSIFSHALESLERAGLAGGGLRAIFNRCSLFTLDMVENRKPMPDMFFLAAKAMDLEPADVIVFGDSVNDVLAAKAAGMGVVGVTIAYGHPETKKELAAKLRNAGADDIIDDFSKVLCFV